MRTTAMALCGMKTSACIGVGSRAGREQISIDRRRSCTRWVWWVGVWRLQAWESMHRREEPPPPLPPAYPNHYTQTADLTNVSRPLPTNGRVLKLAPKTDCQAEKINGLMVYNLPSYKEIGWWCLLWNTFDTATTSLSFATSYGACAVYVL
jgi:hypothetical protein